tara:strand:+ start:163 stop:597 length:435 start_codon:yes stop_codon:yes gene_type:complete
MVKSDVMKLVHEVAEARGMLTEELMHGPRVMDISSARRAFAMILWDKYSMNGQHAAVSWSDVSELVGIGRSSLHASARRWRELEGAQDGKEEARLREKGCLLPQGKESIHQMAKRLCKRRAGEMPEGRSCELGYWRSKEEVNHG